MLKYTVSREESTRITVFLQYEMNVIVLVVYDRT